MSVRRKDTKDLEGELFFADWARFMSIPERGERSPVSAEDKQAFEAPFLSAKPKFITCTGVFIF